MIPRRLNYIWIGSPIPPLVRHCIESWVKKHPGWQHKIWKDEKDDWENQDVIDAMATWNGKADVMRAEILAECGGVCVDADSFCECAIDDSLLQWPAVASYENETCREGLIACGFLAGEPGNAFWRACVDECAHADVTQPAWMCVGPGLITRVAQRMPGALHVLPARHFIPKHYSGVDAPGDAKIYARQLWGSTFGYDKIAKTASDDPLVTVVIPCFKQARWLGDAIRSVKAQTYQNVQIVVAAGDDESFAEAAKQDVKVIRDGGKGLANARNVAIEASNGEYILPLDADDMLAPNFLSKTVPLAAENVIVGTQLFAFGDRFGVITLPPYDRSQILIDNPTFVCSLFSKKLWERVGGYDVAPFGYEDWSFWLSCIEHGARIERVEEPLFHYRTHAAQDSQFCMRHDDILRAMVRLLHPGLAGERRERDLVVVREMPDEVRERMKKRRACFPNNSTLRTWLPETA